jgi:hypothetical protein
MIPNRPPTRLLRPRSGAKTGLNSDFSGMEWR